jgi:hypothetical protein
LLVFNHVDNLERCSLCPGNIHSTDGWRSVAESIAVRYRHGMNRRYFGDTAKPGVYELFEAEEC